MQTGVAYVGLPREEKLWVIDDDPLIPQTLERAGYVVAAKAATFDDGKTLLSSLRGAGITVLVDYRLDSGHRGTDLFIGQRDTSRFFLCSSDYDSPDLLKRAREVGARVLPKPLCFMAPKRSGH